MTGKIEPAAPMYAVVRLDNQGTPYVDGLTIGYDKADVIRSVGYLDSICPTLPVVSPIVMGERGYRFAVVEVRFVKWEDEES